MLPVKNSLEGILLIDKPMGITSHDVVNRVKRYLRIKRVGHAGTLDPMATGLLIILVGRATKISQYLMSLDKVYTGRLKLGESTESHDSDGKVTETKPVPDLSEEQIRTYFKTFLGDQYQIPPMYSAKKINGVPLYKMARQGKTVEREPRFIRISDFLLHDFELPCADFSIACSKGTYVRTVIHDLGQKIGCGAHMIGLRRTQIDRFHIKDGFSTDAIEAMTYSEIQRALIPSYQAAPSNLL